MESLNDEMARKTVKRYACSNCWGDLKIIPDITKQEMYFVICETCLDETKGYVTKYFVNRRRGVSEFEKRDVTRLLQKLSLLPSPVRTPLKDGETRVMANLRELGF